jgi:MoxR-like ATPase
MNETAYDILKPSAEIRFRKELDYLISVDSATKPENWQLSPQAVVDYIMGKKFADGFEIEPKYIGKRNIIEMAVATLATDRALLLMGLPGTAKSWVSEHLAAAISGDSGLLVQGTAGLSEESLRYNWNFALLIAQGPSKAALIASPVMKAMEKGAIVRIEELTRIPAEIQDSLITVLSEKLISIPELNQQVFAKKGFNLIATANDKDKGVHELSSAMKRRFNTIYLPLPESLEDEVKIVQQRLGDFCTDFNMKLQTDPIREIEKLVILFRELRTGKTIDGKLKLKIPSSTLSTAEAISVMTAAQSMATYFSKGEILPEHMFESIYSTIVRDKEQDLQIWKEYLETVMRNRADWENYYQLFKDILR